MKIEAPRRVRHAFVQQLLAKPADVFPLLCPVREADWIEGWDPLVVLSDSGVCEEDCIFTTEASPIDAVWYVTRHQAPSFLQMLKITPAVTVCKIDIALKLSSEGCTAEVSYEHTSLGPAGDAVLDAFTEDNYRRFMLEWEARLNHFLATGNCAPLEE